MSQPEVIALASKKFNFLTPSKAKQAFQVSLRARNRREYSPQSNDGTFSSPKNFTMSASDLMESNIDLVATLKFRIQFDGAGNNTVENVKKYLGLRCFPVNSAMQNVSVTGLNGISPSENPYENITFYSYMMNEENRSCASQAYRQFESNRSPTTATQNIFRPAESTEAGEQSNGLGNGYEVLEVAAANVGGTDGVNVRLRIKERLQCQPFQWWSGEECVPFNQVGQFQLAVQMLNDGLVRMLGVASDCPSFTLRAYNSNNAWDASTQDTIELKAVIETIIPSISVNVPPRILYDAPRINYYSQSINGGSLAAGAEVKQQSFNLGNLTTVPSLFAVYVKEDETRARQSGNTYSDGMRQIDRHAVITRLSIQVGSNNVALEDLSLEGLYRMSRRNGYNKPFGAFTGSLLGTGQASGYDVAPADAPFRGNGQVIYFKPSDMALNDIFYVANSASQPINVGITVDIKNPYQAGDYTDAADADLANLKFYCLALEDNVVDTQYNKWSEYRPILTGQQIENAPLRLAHLDESDNQLGGKSILDSLKRGWKDVTGFLGKHKGDIKKARQVADMASDIAVAMNPEALPAKMAYDAVSQAMANRGYGGALVPVAGKKRGRPAKKAGRPKKAKAKGGKSMTDAALKKLLKKL